MHTWKVTKINEVSATVTYGPLTFNVQIIKGEHNIVVLKSSSFYLDHISHKEMIATVQRAYAQTYCK